MLPTEGRMLRKSISNSKGFAKLSPHAAVLFCMIIPHLNAHGKSNGGTGFVKDEICPLIKYLPAETIPKLMAEISRHTNLKFFKKGGRWWIHSMNFLKKHQKLRPDRLGRDLLPSYIGKLPNSSNLRTHKEEVKLREEEVIDEDGSKLQADEDWNKRRAARLAELNEHMLKHKSVGKNGA